MFSLNKPTGAETDAELFRTVQSGINTATDAEMDNAMAERIRARVLSQIGSAPPRRRLLPRRAFAATACAALVAIAVGLLLPAQRPGVSPPAGTVAYARVEKAMEQVRYVQWTQTERNVNREGENAIVTIERMYARLDGQNSALVQDDVDRIVFGARNHYPALWKKRILWDKRGVIIYYYDNKKSVLSPTWQPPFTKGKTLAMAILRRINAPKVGSPVRAKHTFFVLPDVRVKSSSKDTGFTQSTEQGADGKPVLVFRGSAAVSDTLTVQKKEISLSAQYSRTIWVNPDTLRVVRSEYVTHMKDGFDTTTVCDNFVYNVPPPAGTFDWKTPVPAKKRKR